MKSGFIKTIGGLLSVIVTVGCLIFAMEARYAHKALAQSNRQMIVQHKLEHREERVLQRIWALEKYFGFKIAEYPEKYRSEYRKLKLELERIRRELKK